MSVVNTYVTEQTIKPSAKDEIDLLIESIR